MTAYANFCGPSYTSQSLVADAELCVNLYPEVLQSEGARVKRALYPTPGVTSFARTNQVGGKAMYGENGRCWGVVGLKLAELAADGTPTYLGDVKADGDPAQITSNGDGGNQLLIATGNEGYSYNKVTGAFANSVHNVKFVGMVDEFGVALDPATSTFKISASLDFTSWDPTQIVQRSDAPDPWKSMLVVPPQIFLIGERTTSVFIDKGTSPMPFGPRAGLIIQQGIVAPFSAAAPDGVPIWLGQNADGDRVVYLLNGYSPVQISTEGMEWAIAQYARVDDARAWTYQRLGHTFYVLTFPSANATWVYDKKIGQWHQRDTWNVNAGRGDAWHASCHVKAFGYDLVGDSASGVIYRLDETIGTDIGGGPLRRVRRGPGLYNEGRRIFLSNFALDFEPGLGAAVGQGADPMIMFRNSWDGGKTWGAERLRSAGKQGQYGTQAIWNGLGSGSHFVPEISFTDPVPFRVLGANYNVPTWQAA